MSAFWKWVLVAGAGLGLTGLWRGAGVAGEGKTEGGKAVSVRVVGITDGDTITVRRGEETLKVRLSGIDAPEKGQAFGAAAKGHLSELLAGRTVSLAVEGTDVYGRTLGRVVAGGERTKSEGRSPKPPLDVNVAMVRDGFAWHFAKYDKSKDLAAAQREAFAAKRGLWADKEAVAPWVYRAARRSPKRQTSSAREAPSPKQ